jgi:isoleucyl-tRNA synthetase
VVRLVQEARKASGLEVSDRIALTWSASDPDLAAALREHGAAVAGEVLATTFAEGTVGPDARVDEELGLSFSLRTGD